MSAAGRAYAERYSPYKGATLHVHEVIGDKANDLHDNEFWMSVTNLARRCRLGRRMAGRAIATLVKDGFLALVEDAAFGGLTPAKPARYRMLFPEVPVVFELSSGATPGRTDGAHSIPSGAHTGRTGGAHSVTERCALSAHKPKLRTEAGISTEAEEGDPAGGPAAPAPSGPATLLAFWNELCPDLPKALELNQDRLRRAGQRLAEHTLVQHRMALERLNASAFCRGLNDRGWRADFDFYLRPASYNRIMEGRYDNRPHYDARTAGNLQAARDFMARNRA